MAIDHLRIISRIRPNAGWPTRTGLEQLGVVAAAAVLAAFFLIAYFHHPALPLSNEQLGWFKWFDQERYYNAAVAWAHGNLDPALHWYLPGYSLMGAPFARFMPLHTFLIPNLVCVLLSLWLFAKITARLAPELPCAKLLGAVVFLVCTAFKPEILDVWVAPNSTTGSTPLIYGALLATLIFVETPRPRYAFLAALLACAIAAFRPTDAVPLVAAIGVVMLVTMLRARLSLALAGAVVGAALLGALLSLGSLAIAYLSIYGFRESGYMQIGNMIGFEWHLLPVRFIMLVIDPRPTLMDGEGLAGRFPWVIPGLIGSIALLVFPPVRSRRLIEVLFASAILMHIAIYCAFRDLHPINLIRFTNYHYFKWIFPILALYAVRLAFNVAAGRERLRLTAAAVVTAAVLFPWRVELRALPAGDAPPAKFENNTVSFRTDLTDVQNTVLVAAADAANDTAVDELTIAGRTWGGLIDFRVYAQPSGLMLAMLRPFGRGEAVLKVDPRITLNPEVDPLNARLQIVAGLPCLLWSERPVCQGNDLLPAPLFPASGSLTLDNMASRYFTVGWSFIQDGGIWTDGRLAGLRFRMKDTPSSLPLQIAIDAAAYMPPGGDPRQVRLQVNAHPIKAWTLPTGGKTTLTATIPAEIVSEKPDITVSLRIDNPKSPHDASSESRDVRLLGLFVSSMTLKY